MIAVLFGLGTFFAAMLIHIIWFQIRLPKASMRVLSYIFVFTLLTGLILIWAWVPAIGIYGALHGMLLYASLALTYLLTFIAIKSDSPTLSLVYFLFKNRADGVTDADLREFMASRPFVRSRLDQLYQDGFIHQGSDRLRLTKRSTFSFLAFDFFRTLMGRSTRGG